VIEVRVSPTLWSFVCGVIDKEAIETIGYSELSNRELINEHRMDWLFVFSAGVTAHQKFTRRNYDHLGFDY